MPIIIREMNIRANLVSEDRTPSENGRVMATAKTETAPLTEDYIQKLLLRKSKTRDER